MQEMKQVKYKQGKSCGGDLKRDRTTQRVRKEEEEEETNSFKE
jgi:hypothetical protein